MPACAIERGLSGLSREQVGAGGEVPPIDARASAAQVLRGHEQGKLLHLGIVNQREGAVVPVGGGEFIQGVSQFELLGGF